MPHPFCHQPSYRTAQPLPMLPSTPSLVPLSASASLHARPPDAAFSAAAERSVQSSQRAGRQLTLACVSKLAAFACRGGQKARACATHVAPCLHPAPTKLRSDVPRFAQAAPCQLQVVKPSTMLKECKSARAGCIAITLLEDVQHLTPLLCPPFLPSWSCSHTAAQSMQQRALSRGKHS